MDKNRPVADRVRPILHAMEQSIENARRRRLNRTGSETSPEPAPEPPTPVPATVIATAGIASEHGFRLKAHPKRGAVILPEQDPQLRSRARLSAAGLKIA